jgi:hypothetical protein
MHHALGDGAALLMWLETQLSGVETNAQMNSKIQVRRAGGAPLSSGPKKSISLICKQDLVKPTAQKRWQTLWLSKEELQLRISRESPGVTLNDWLCAAVFKALNTYLISNNDPLGLWVPVNMRRSPFAGFGNASSRVRVYLDPSSLSGPVDLKNLGDLARRVRAQSRNGLASVSSAVRPLLAMNEFIANWVKVLLRLYFSRASMDPCTSAFSFITRVSRRDEGAAFPGVRSVETIGQLYHRHSIAFSGACFRDRVALTVFWDPAQVSDLQAGQVFSTLKSVLG